MKALAGRDRRAGRFRWELVVAFAFLDFALLVGIYVFNFLLSMLELEGAFYAARERFMAFSEWSIETLMLPMLVVCGLTWYGTIINALLHGFIVERVYEFFRQRGGRKVSG